MTINEQKATEQPSGQATGQLATPQKTPRAQATRIGFGSNVDYVKKVTDGKVKFLALLEPPFYDREVPTGANASQQFLVFVSAFANEGTANSAEPASDNLTREPVQKEITYCHNSENFTIVRIPERSNRTLGDFLHANASTLHEYLGTEKNFGRDEIAFRELLKDQITPLAVTPEKVTISPGFSCHEQNEKLEETPLHVFGVSIYQQASGTSSPATNSTTPPLPVIFSLALVAIFFTYRYNFLQRLQASLY